MMLKPLSTVRLFSVVAPNPESTMLAGRAIEYVASGKLGKICLVKAWMCQVRGSIGKPPDSPVPPCVDYDVWLGPAPKRPFNKNRFHYNWRCFWDYGNTEPGNQGVHMLDVAMWGIQAMRGVANCLPQHVSGTSGIYTSRLITCWRKVTVIGSACPGTRTRRFSTAP